MKKIRPSIKVKQALPMLLVGAVYANLLEAIVKSPKLAPSFAVILILTITAILIALAVTILDD